MIERVHLAATRILLNLLATKGDTRLGGRRGTGLILHSSLDLTRHGQECLFDIGRGLCGGFQKLNTKAVGKLLTLLGRYHALPLEIALITH